MSRAQPLDETTGPAGVDAFIRAEIDDFIQSATVRIEQQRIHIKVLCGDALAKAGAKERLKTMMEGSEKLQDYRRQLTR
jgi:hypothetical protein